MAAGWSTVLLCAGCLAAGYGLRDWQYQRARADSTEQQLVRAEQQPAVQIQADRRITQAEAEGRAGRQQGRAAVGAADLGACVLTDELGGLLAGLATSTRNAAADLDMPGHVLPRSRDAAASRRGAR